MCVRHVILLQWKFTRVISLSLSQLTEIMQLMNAYFSATHRQLGKDDCISMETNPKLRPSLLELPSHPVWREEELRARAHTHTHMDSEWCTHANAVLTECFPVRSFCTEDKLRWDWKEQMLWKWRRSGKCPGSHKQESRSRNSLATPPAKSRKGTGPPAAPATWKPAKYHREHNSLTSECKKSFS